MSDEKQIQCCVNFTVLTLTDELIESQMDRGFLNTSVFKKIVK